MQLPSPTFAHIDAAMHKACSEARKFLGATSPNPPVGAVAIDSEGCILAAAAHEKAGGPHAEVALLELCRTRNLISRIHTLCVTLEPCNHHGHTPPCTSAILSANIKNVVIGTRDPNPHVAGGGAEHLRRAGINVMLGVNEPECLHLILAFSKSVRSGFPLLTIKRAFNIEGSMIPASGHTTFTSPASLAFAHRLRKKADAIITGGGTILADNPRFTIRHVKDFANKRRILAILDRRLRVPTHYIHQAETRGFEVIRYDNIEECLGDLGKKEIRDALLEAGPALSSSLLDQGQWNINATIQQQGAGMEDKITTTFNPSQLLPFAVKDFCWNYFLPADDLDRSTGL